MSAFTESVTSLIQNNRTSNKGQVLQAACYITVNYANEKRSRLK